MNMTDNTYNKSTMAGFFLDGWYVFDNFAPCQVEWRGVLYPTSEHAYQAAHFLIPIQPGLNRCACVAHRA